MSPAERQRDLASRDRDDIGHASARGTSVSSRVDTEGPQRLLVSGSASPFNPAVPMVAGRKGVDETS